MKKSTIILVLSALVLYLFYKNRKAVSGSEKKYKLIKDVDFNYGYVFDQAGNQITFDAIAPQIGDILEGEIAEQNEDGINYKGLLVNVSFGSEEKNNATIFIPEENLQLV